MNEAETFPKLGDLIVYDGVCVLCSRSVRFVAERDPEGRFRFVPLQSALGRELAASYGIDAGAARSMIAIIGDKALFRSEAAIGILERLPRTRWARLLRVFPRVLRDAVYDLIGRNRYRWFGRYEACRLPPDWLRARVIETAEQLQSSR